MTTHVRLPDLGWQRHRRDRLHRAHSERELSPRERRLLSFVHGELGELIGRSLVSATEPRPDKLSPRLRQTLARLLEGDSEKGPDGGGLS